MQVSENSDSLEALEKLTDTAVEETNNWLEEEFGVWSLVIVLKTLIILAFKQQLISQVT